MKDLFKLLERENYCIHCATEKEARALCNEMDKAGMKWNFGGSYADYTNFEPFGEHTVYYPTMGLFGDNRRVHRKFHIYEFTDLFDGFSYEYRELEDLSRSYARSRMCKVLGCNQYDLEPCDFMDVLFDREGRIIAF